MRDIDKKENICFKPIKSKLSDIELVALVSCTEYRSIESEHQLFRELKGSSLKVKKNVAFTTEENE